jgi:hypothetical protein
VNFIKKIVRAINKRFQNSKVFYTNEIKQEIDHLKVLSAKSNIEINRTKTTLNIEDYEFKVFSQFGEDGIINFLIEKTKIQQDEKYFIEFGVGDYTECNSKFLLINNYWNGLVIEGDYNSFIKIKNSQYCWKYGLKVINKWIKNNNIKQIIEENIEQKKIGLLSIDIDGNDYWIWKEINNINPIILIIEWNSLFGKKENITIPYDEKFVREEKHFSGQYWGASISALAALGKKKGYSLIGSNSAGNNLFFVRSDRKQNLVERLPREAYRKQIFSDSRDKNKKLNFLNNSSKIKQIENLEVLDLEKNQLIKISDLNLIQND